MIDETLLKKILRNMRIAFINSGIYDNKHPLVAKAIDELGNIINKVLTDQTSIELGFTAESILIDKEEFKDDRLYEEAARYFHIRKIKSIRFETGFANDELMLFVTEFSASPRKIQERGGLRAFLEKNKLLHIQIKELDYSPLLGEGGKEIAGDVWDYLLGKVGSINEAEDVDVFISNLVQAIEKINFRQLAADSDEFLHLKDIVAQLKDKMPQVSQSLNQEVLKTILRKQEQIPDENMSNQVRILFCGLSRKDQVDVLWNEVFGSKNFNTVIFSVFDQLVDSKDKEEYMDEWTKRIQANPQVIDDPQLKERVRNMLTMEETDVYMPEMYRRTLALLSAKIGVDLKMMLNKKAISRNYLFALLNLLSWEAYEEGLISLCDEIFANSEEIALVNLIGFLQKFHQALKSKYDEVQNAQIKRALQFREDLILSKVEGLIVEGVVEIEEEAFKYFAGVLEHSQLTPDMYLQKIFGTHCQRRYVLCLFLKFFPHLHMTFIEQLKRESAHVGILKEIISTLHNVDTRQVYLILKDIFLMANPLLKVEVLRAMQDSSYVEDVFILDNLRQDNVFLKKELVSILKKKPADIQVKAIDLLLSVFNLFGINNRILLENIRVLREAQLTHGRKKLEDLLRWFFVWGGSSLKQEIQRTLTEFKKR